MKYAQLQHKWTSKFTARKKNTHTPKNETATRDQRNPKWTNSRDREIAGLEWNVLRVSLKLFAQFKVYSIIDAVWIK